MTKEKIFADLKDIILTLKSPNIKDSNVKNRWKDKSDKVLKMIGGLKGEDRQWLSREYRLWFKEKMKS